VAENCMEVHEVMRTALYYGQPSLAESMLADLLGQHADRLDAVYDMAVIAAWRDERARACELSQMCMEAAPTCAEVNGLYQLFKTDMRENKGKAISGMPLRPYGSGSGISRMMDALHFAEMNDQELLRAMTAYPLQPRLVDAMVAMPPALQERTIGLAAQLEAADEEAFLRLCLLWSGLSLPMCWSIVKRLRELGVTGPVVADADHRLQTLDPQEDA